MEPDQTGDATTTAEYPRPPSEQPSAEPPASSPSPKRSGRGRLLILVLVAALVLGGAGTGGYFANVSLSSTYSPERAVTDYFGAQKRGDVARMTSNATFLRGDGSFDDLFGQDALRAMMGVRQNLDVQAVRVKSS